jgi:hypothetical protein
MFLDKLIIQQEIPLARTLRGQICNYEPVYRSNTEITLHELSLGLGQLQTRLLDPLCSWNRNQT